MTIKEKNSFFISFILVIISFAFAYYEPLNQMLLSVDRQISLCINPTLAEKNIWTIFWAIMNKTVERYISISIMIVIALIFIFKSTNRKLAITLVISMILYLELATIIKYFLIRLFDINRHSPSYVIENYHRLSQLFQDNTIKDGSGASFPGDHALVLLFIAFYSWRFYPKKLRNYTCFFAVFFVIPRVVSGAHWASDVVGTTIIAFFYTNLIVLTPLHDYTVKLIEAMLNKCSRSSVG